MNVRRCQTAVAVSEPLGCWPHGGLSSSAHVKGRYSGTWELPCEKVPSIFPVGRSSYEFFLQFLQDAGALPLNNTLPRPQLKNFTFIN